MLLLITFLAFMTIFLLIYLLLSAYVPIYGPIEMRLKALENVNQGRSDIEEELAKPFSKRIISPFIKNLAEFFMQFTPHSLRRIIEERMAMAGGFGRLSVDEFLLLCGFLAICLPAVTGSLLTVMKMPVNKVVGMSIIACIIGLIVPVILLNQKMAARKLSIQKDLPDVLDLLTVSVEAGLGFDGALAKLTEKMKGVLVEEFNRVLQEIRMGVSRREALATLGKRCDVSDLSMFTTSLIQADQLGVSIGNVLRVQSVSMREKRKQRAEEKAMKAPIKMMLPLVLFIFPSIFIVLLGPAVIQIATTFGNK
ncbi:MAG: type II secretion system F family protein [Sporomusaceae bacterium]|nr:type II secretion system F family protein [Sporomusaceae bacterium]